MAYVGIGLVVGLGLASGLRLGRVVRIRQAIYWHGVKWSSPPFQYVVGRHSDGLILTPRVRRPSAQVRNGLQRSY